MHHTPDLKSKAATLRQLILDDFKLDVPHQEALRYVARLEGYKDWQTASAAQQAAVSDADESGLLVVPCEDTAGCAFYTALATVDVTMSAHIGVWAKNKGDAADAIREHAQELYQAGEGFALDDGNHRRACDFYMNDSLECVSRPEVEGDDAYVDATYQVDESYRRVQLSRNEPDHARDDRRARVETTLTLSKGITSVSRTLRSDVCGDLQSYVRTAIQEGDFDEEFKRLSVRLEKACRTTKRKLRAAR